MARSTSKRALRRSAKRSAISRVQLTDDHRLNNLIDGQRPTCRHAIISMVHLVNQISAKQNIHGCGPANFIVTHNGLQVLADQGFLKARARNTIKSKIENQKMVVQGPTRI
jgi:hypothetical protein